VLYVLALLVSIALYNAGFPPYTVILSYFIADAMSRFNQIYLLHRYIKFDLGNFMQKSYLRPLGVFICGVAYVLASECINIKHDLWHITNFVTACLFMVSSIYFVGLYKEERSVITSHIKHYITHNKGK
jgi:hypothetical protein